MATLALAIAGAAAGSALLPAGISLLGATVTGAAIGSQIGALAGSYIDNALFGPSGGSRAVEGPRLQKVHLTASSEGAPIPRIYGRVRLGGQVIWADAITEEILAKVEFDRLADTLPPIGELAEVTVALPPLAATPIVPNASIKRLNGKTGVWLIENDMPQYVPVEIGASDLDGRVQILRGLEAGDNIVLYSKQELTPRSRISIVDSLVDTAR